MMMQYQHLIRRGSAAILSLLTVLSLAACGGSSRATSTGPMTTRTKTAVQSPTPQKPTSKKPADSKTTAKTTDKILTLPGAVEPPDGSCENQLVLTGVRTDVPAGTPLNVMIEYAVLSLKNTGKACLITVPDTLEVSSELPHPVSKTMMDIDNGAVVDLENEEHRSQYTVPPGAFTIIIGDSWWTTQNKDPAPCAEPVKNVHSLQLILGWDIITAQLKDSWPEVCFSKPQVTFELGSPWQSQ